MKKINRIIALMMTLVMLTGTYGPALNVYASEAEKTASYWYIDNYFEDASGHGFIFSKPDSKGNPTEVTISGYLEKKENNGTFGFKMLEGQMSPAEYSSDPWIVGTIKGSCDIFKKDELRDSQGRYLYIDVETK